MKVLMINGSPRKDGNCARLLSEAEKTFQAENVEVIRYDLGTKDIRGCMACGGCATKGACVIEDDVNVLASHLAECDGMIVASPVYYASPNGTLISLLDRLFMSAKADLRMKVGASFAVARRAGTVATFDVLNKYYTINQMPVASGRYWNNGFGRGKGEIEGDEEGLQNARFVARNMVFLMRSIALGKEKYGLPAPEAVTRTGFIR
ncbi:MAG TPA: flavodoxin family protein [Clostridiales bacterium]|nr:flavodoxin family protein [Clostridiales bacterium]